MEDKPGRWVIYVRDSDITTKHTDPHRTCTKCLSRQHVAIKAVSQPMLISPSNVIISAEAHLESDRSHLLPAMATTILGGPCWRSSLTQFFSVWKESW